MRILIIEDSILLLKSLRAAFSRTGYAVDSARDGEEGLWMACDQNYDAIILDIMLPKLDGLSLLVKLRERGSQSHVLLLTAKDKVDDKVIGFRLGADDYLVKPFALEELLARVSMLCRRAYGNKDRLLTIADLVVDMDSMTVSRAGKKVDLKPREYRLLEYLMNRQGQLVTRDEIETHIYDHATDLMSNAVDSAICSVRRKINKPNPTPLIHTRRGLGYIIEER